MTFIDTLYNARLTDKPQPLYKQKFFTKNISSDIRNIRQWSEALPTEDIKTICDLTGNVGTESIYFTRTLPNIEKTDIYEIDVTTYQQLQENVGALPKPIQQKIFTHNSTSENVIDFYDLILFDPPWGGADYTQGKKDEFDEYRKQIYQLYRKHSKLYPEQPIETIELKLGDKPIRKVIHQCLFGILALKIPLNAQESPFANNFKQIKNDGIKPLYIPIIYNNQIKYLIALYTRDPYTYEQLWQQVKQHHIRILPPRITLANAASLSNNIS